MPRAVISWSAAVLMLSLVAVAYAADKEKKSKHQGTVVSASAETLVMTDAKGKEHSHSIGAETKVTLDGKMAQAADLKAGDKITVTQEGDKVVSVAAKRAAAKKG